MPDRTITETELTEAFKRHRYADFTSPLHAKQLVDDIVAHREQVWEYGDVVKSARGHYYRRTHEDKWVRFGELGMYTHDYPTRPLKFMSNDWV